VSRTDATTSRGNRPRANRRDRAGSTQRPRLRKNGSSKTAGTAVRDRSRHGGRRAIGPGASIVGPRAAGIRRGQPAAPWRALRGPVGFYITGGSPIQPEKATGTSPVPPSPTTPSTTASCRPTSRCAPRGHHGSRSPPEWKDKELLQFCQRRDVIIAGAYQCAARQSVRAQTRLRKRRCEPGAGPAQLRAFDVRFNGGMPS
jgi:hypothetical protein